MSPHGIGTVLEAAPLLGMVKVRLDEAPEAVPTPYHRDTVTLLDKKEEPRGARTEPPKNEGVEG